MSLIIQRLLWLQGKVLAMASVPKHLLGLPHDRVRLERRQEKTLCTHSEATLQRILQFPSGFHAKCSTLGACYQRMMEKINGNSEELFANPQLDSSPWDRELPPQSNFVHMVQGEYLIVTGLRICGGKAPYLGWGTAFYTCFSLHAHLSCVTTGTQLFLG